MTALLTHFGLEFRSTLRSPGLVLLVYLFPLAFYVLMGLVMVPLNPPFADVLLPAMVLFTVMTPMLLGLPGPIVDYREAGIFRGYRVHGIPTAALLGIPATTLALHSLISAGIVGLSAGPIFDAAPPENAIALVLVVLAAVFVFTGLGMLFGVVSSDNRMTVIWSQAIFLPSMLLGGMMVPVDVLPNGMRPVSMLLPTTHLMQLAESWAYGGDALIPPLVAALALFVSGLIAYGLAAWGFSWEPGGQERRLHPALAFLPLLPLGLAALTL